MRLSWNEIRARAADLAREWADAAYENCWSNRRPPAVTWPPLASRPARTSARCPNGTAPATRPGQHRGVRTDRPPARRPQGVRLRPWERFLVRTVFACSPTAPESSSRATPSCKSSRNARPPVARTSARRWRGCFQVLNTTPNRRSRALDENLARFPARQRLSIPTTLRL